MKKIVSLIMSMVLIFMPLCRLDVYGDSDSSGAVISQEMQISLDWWSSGVLNSKGQFYVYGQLGNGKEPELIAENVKEIAMGGKHGGYITQDDTLYMWGRNLYGQVCGPVSTTEFSPIKIMEDVQSFSLGWHHSSAIDKSGDLYVWGQNDFGQLGNGTTKNSGIPLKIMENVAQVSLGGKHSAALKTNGDLYMWGLNAHGQLGDGTFEDKSTPVYIMSNVKEVILGGSHSAAITNNGDLYVWGYNQQGQVGDWSDVNRSTPVKVLENVKSASLGGNHSAAITENGDLYVWGYNQYGQLGNGSKNGAYTPIKLMEKVKSVSVKEAHSAVITENNKIYMWGYNEYGQLGDGTVNESLVPIRTIIPGESNEIQKDIMMYSNGNIGHLEVGETVLVKVSLFEDGIEADSQGIFSFATSNADVIELGNYCPVDDGTIFSITAKTNGTTTLTVTDNESGEKAYAIINVGDIYENCSADFVPIYDANGHLYNYYEAGMFVSDFVKTDYSEDYYRVTMNVYNTCQLYGALEIHDANGNIIKSERIDKFEGVHLTSIGDAFGKVGNLIQDTIDGNACTFKSQINSMCTPIDVLVPKGGYLFLTNSTNKSESCLLYNSMDIIVFCAMEAIGIVGDEDMEKGLHDELMEMLSEEYIKEQFVEKMKEELAKEITLDNGVQLIFDLTGNSYSIIQDLGIDWEELIENVAMDVMFSLPEDAFIKLSGFAGVALKSMFATGKYGNFATQVVDTLKYKNIDGIRIDTKTSQGELSDNGIKVATQDEEYVLRTFYIKEGDDINQTELALGKEDFVLYDIYMLKNDEETQPTGTVTVSIPIPQQYDSKRLKVYRIENGARVDMNARIEGDYLVFETNHFSLYAVTEDDILFGDANNDEKIDTQDAVLLKKYLAGYTDLGINEEACDVNGDGEINSADAVILLKHLAGYDVGLAS